MSSSEEVLLLLSTGGGRPPCSCGGGPPPGHLFLHHILPLLRILTQFKESQDSLSSPLHQKKEHLFNLVCILSVLDTASWAKVRHNKCSKGLASHCIVKQKPLSLFISLFLMFKNAFDNVRIEK